MHRAPAPDSREKGSAAAVIATSLPRLRIRGSGSGRSGGSSGSGSGSSGSGSSGGGSELRDGPVLDGDGWGVSECERGRESERWE